MRLLLLLSTMAAMPPMTRAFVATPTSKAMPKATSSTTLYYRDDVPPIGSSPYWETPNDFQQFLTQCSIQSFMFLLRSLRDDHTMQWLHDFTDPVMMQQQQQQNATITTNNSNKPSAKVSLAEAAQSALLNTEKALTDGIITKPDTEVTSKTTLPTTKKENKSAMKQKKAKKSAKSKKATANNHKNKAVSQPSTALLSMLKDRAAIKSAFSHYTVGMYLATPKREDRPVSNTDTTSAPISSNTGVSALYSSVPTRQIPPTAMKKSFSPFAGKKHKPVPPTPFSSGPFTGAGKKHKPVPASPFNSGPSFTGANTASSTASLYGAPADKPEPKKEDNTKASSTKNVGNQKKADSTSSSSKSNNDYKTFPKSNPVALKYHGLAILNRTRFPTWESYFEQLLEQPKESFLVESYHANIPTYEMDIDPASLVRRMLSVRMQIAQEFEHDLEVIARMGGLTLKSYQKMLREIREQRAEEELQQQKDQLEKQMPKSMEDAISHNNGASATDDVENGKPTNKKAPKPTVQRANLLFLESAVVANGASADYAPSPLRKSNFDLLCLLATQEAIHRVLNDPSRQARKSPEHGSNQFLQDFYVTRLLSHFSGDQKYGRSDDFLEELLDCPPRMITVHTGEDGKAGDDSNTDELTKDLTYLVDPVKVAETILNEREKVALEWKQQLEQQTKEDHMALQKMILAKLMGGTIDECQIVDSEGQDLEDEFDSCFE